MRRNVGKKLIIHKVIGTAFGAGYCPVAPGTAGAAVGLLSWLLLLMVLPLADAKVVVAMLTAAMMLMGTRAASELEKIWGQDPSRVVVDELVGTWIALLAVPSADWWWGVAAFALFRLFDIAKPLGIRRMEAIGGGLGIMMDDVLAGVYSAAVLLVAGVFV